MEHFISFLSGFFLGVTTCLLIKPNLNKENQDDSNRYRRNNKKRHHF